MNASPLATIPAELRNEIYSYLFELPTPIILTPNPKHHGKKLSQTGTTTKHLTALAQTCRQLHHETTAMILGQNKFLIRANLSSFATQKFTTGVHNWLHDIQRYHLKNVSIHLLVREHTAPATVAHIIRKCKQHFQYLSLRLEISVVCEFEGFKWDDSLLPFRCHLNHQSAALAYQELTRALRSYRSTQSWDRRRMQKYLRLCVP